MHGSEFPEATPATGIVWAYRFSPDGSAAPIAPHDVDAAIAAHDGGWIWVHLALADMRCRTWITKSAPVSPLGRDTLVGTDTHVRLDVAGREILGILPDLHQEFAQPGEELVRLRFVLSDRLLLTSRNRPVHSIEAARQAIVQGKSFPNAISMLDAVIDEFADSVARLGETLAEALDSFEDRVMQDDLFCDRRELGRVRLQTVRVHRQLAHLRGVFHRLEPRVANHTQLAEPVRRLSQKLDAIDQEFRNLHDRARLIVDEVAAHTAATTNHQLFTLSVLTACILPPTLVTGFFGINTKDMPFQDVPGGTWMALSVAVAAGFAAFLVLRRMRTM